MQTWLNKVKENPLEFLTGICILMIAASGGALRNVASSALAIIFIASLFYFKHWKHTWQGLDKAEKLLLVGFVLYTLTALLSRVNASDTHEFTKEFGRYIRFTLIIPVYLMMRMKSLRLSQYFLVGVVSSGFVYFVVALNSVIENPAFPASGHYHHITFGDAAMLNIGIMGVMLLLSGYRPIINILISISLLCASYAVLLSQARGAWVMLPLYLLAAITYLFLTRRADAIKLILISVIAAIALMLSPAGTIVKARYNDAVTEVSQFDHGVRYDTSVGGRLSMWDIAFQVWKEHPLLGTGLGDFDEDMKRYQAEGNFPNIAVHSSTHNIFVQALVSTGALGLAALFYALVISPLVLFKNTDKEVWQWSIMGAVLVSSYVVFGLSESWILRAPAVSIYLAYLILLVINTRKPEHTNT
jgi:O-antigen ligase